MFLSILSDEGKRLFYDLEVLLARADGDFGESEEAIIRTHCNEMGIEYSGGKSTEVDVDSLIKLINEELSDSEKRAIFIELIIVTLADAEYHDNEKAMINKLRDSFGISEEQSIVVFEHVNNLMNISRSIQFFVG